MRMILCAAALVLGACSGRASDEGAANEPVALVRLARAEPAAVQATMTLYGTAEAGAGGSATLSAPEEAVVASIAAPPGAAVSRGQAVVTLAPSAASRLELTKAASDARAAQLALERMQRLKADGLVSNAELESARAAARSAAATRQSLAARSAALVLRAPAPGHVQTVSASPGSLVPAGSVVATIANAGDLRGRLGIDPASAKRIRPGSLVRITPSGGGAPVTTSILSIDPTVDPQTRLASLYVRIPAGAGIGAGEPLTAQLELPAGGASPTIPYAALLDDAGQAYVYVASGGKALRRNVTTGANDGRRVVVQNGLRAGDVVVVEGVTALEDGMKIRTR